LQLSRCRASITGKVPALRSSRAPLPYLLTRLERTTQDGRERHGRNGNSRRDRSRNARECQGTSLNLAAKQEKWRRRLWPFETEGHRGPPTPSPRNHPRTPRGMPVRLRYMLPNGDPQPGRYPAGAEAPLPRSHESHTGNPQTRCTTPIAGNASGHLASRPTRRLSPTCPSACSAVSPRSRSSLSPFLSTAAALPVTGWRVISPHSKRVARKSSAVGGPASPSGKSSTGRGKDLPATSMFP
jgi:hypothetical protein